MKLVNATDGNERTVRKYVVKLQRVEQEGKKVHIRSLLDEVPGRKDAPRPTVRSIPFARTLHSKGRFETRGPNEKQQKKEDSLRFLEELPGLLRVAALPLQSRPRLPEGRRPGRVPGAFLEVIPGVLSVPSISLDQRQLLMEIPGLKRRHKFSGRIAPLRGKL